MPELMTLERWKKFTDGGVLATRSARLKAVDTALQQYHAAKSPANRERVKITLMVWLAEKGPSWRSDPRNTSHAVEHLVDQVFAVPGLNNGINLQQRADALWFIERKQARLINDLFKGAVMEWRPGIDRKLANQQTAIMMGTQSVGRNVAALAPRPAMPRSSSSSAGGQLMA